MFAATAARCRAHKLDSLELRFPFWTYYQAFRNEPYSFLLDSAKDSERLGKYSFLGGQPSLIFRAKRQYGKAPSAGGLLELIEPGRGNARVTHSIGDPFDCLRGLLEQYRVDASEYAGRPVPCLAGAFGYFGYEAGYFIESLPDLGADDLALPDIYFMFSDALLAHCHDSGRSYLSVIGRGDSDDAARAAAGELREKWLRRIEAFEAHLTLETAEIPPARHNGAGRSLTCAMNAHFDRDSYAAAVRQVKEEILAGKAYEVCLTHRLDVPFAGDPWSLYCELRRINPAPFAAYLNFPEAQVVSSSPERFLSLGSDRIAESRPIKGTRPRGQTPEQDAKLCRELCSSVKDRAENMMIVDLVRNDFGRVSRFGSVVVPELMAVEKYATVFQMVSTIRGELDSGFDGLDLVRACFPGGSMTGAPKIEAMKIIDRLEPVKRGIYSGAIGYFDFAGNLDLSMVIRTIVVKNGRAYLNVGGAIVADSDPIAEYSETMDKARALIAALNQIAINQ